MRGRVTEWQSKLNCNIKQLIKDIGPDYNDPLFSEIAATKVLTQPYIESDTDEYVSSQIWQKQMQYEESDRYVQMSALRYGI